MIYFLTPREQDFGILEFLDYWGRDAECPFSIIHYEDLPDRSTLPSGTYVLSALDQLTPGGLRLVRETEIQLRAPGHGTRVLNSTETTLLRFGLLQELSRNGLNRHRVVRATADAGALHFPVFLREENQHTGPLSALLESADELRAELARAIVRGYSLTELLVVEHCDTADADRSYRKYAAFVIDSQVVPQFLSHGRGWLLDLGRTEFTAAVIEEERSYVEENPHESELRGIFAVAGTQYGRIDYAVKQGVIETWEINLNPTLARYPSLSPELDLLRRPTTELFHRRFLAAFRAVDAGGAGSHSIPIHFSPDSLRASDRMIRRAHRSRIPSAVARAARPVRPLVDSIIKFLSPIIVRAANRPGSAR